MQSLIISSVFSHFLMNFPGLTSSVLHFNITAFLMEHLSPGIILPWYKPNSSGSSSLHTHPIETASYGFAHNPPNFEILLRASSVAYHSIHKQRPQREREKKKKKGGGFRARDDKKSMKKGPVQIRRPKGTGLFGESALKF